MVLPQLTWTVSAAYSLTMAGSNITATEFFTQLRSIILAEEALGGRWWTVSASQLTTPWWLELKRNSNGSPTGYEASFRGFVFGGGVPAAGAYVATGGAPGAGYILVSSAANASTTGPNGDYTTGAPYTPVGTKEFSGGIINCTFAAIASSITPTIRIVQSYRSIYVVIQGSTSVGWFAMGELVEDIDGNGVWACASSIGLYATATVPTTASVSAEQYPGVLQGSNNWAMGSYYNVSLSSQRVFGRSLGAFFATSIANSSPLERISSGKAWLFPVLLADRTAALVTDPPSLFGVLRQMRYGPYMAGVKRIYDGGGVARGYGIVANSTTVGVPLLFDDYQ